jgi:hypothetical protein
MIMLAELFNGTIPLRIQVLAIASSILLLLGVIQLIRHEKLKEGYSILWFLVGLALVLFSTFAGLLDLFARTVGISYSPAALFLILVGGLIMLSLHFSVLASKYDRRIRLLAEEYAILKQKVDDNNKINQGDPMSIERSRAIPTKKRIYHV